LAPDRTAVLTKGIGRRNSGKPKYQKRGRRR
jgi:hypothetical protein